MARKKGLAAREIASASVNNPFQHVPFSEGDLGSYDRSGGGGGKILVDVTAEYRQSLIENITSAAAVLAPEGVKHPGYLLTLVFKLRETGVAKSHRPTTLAEEAGLLTAGHGNIDEMLVGVDAARIAELNRVIRTRTTKAIEANLSAIQKIEPWGRDRRVPEGAPTLRERGRALVRLFRYGQEAFSQHNYESVLAMLKKLNIPYRQLFRSRGLPLFSLLDLDKVSDEAFGLLLDYPGARQIIAEPIFKPFTTHAASSAESTSSAVAGLPAASSIPTVAVFDSGVSAGAKALSGWIEGRDLYVLPPDTNYEHGTMVASLVIDSRHFNDGHDWFPPLQTKVYDVCALETGGSYMSDLEERLRSALKKRPDIKVWNISIGGNPCDEHLFSDFAHTLDKLSDEYNVLFVVAAGNYNIEPRRSWPNSAPLKDRISTPSESVRALTVASITHIHATDAHTLIGQPTPYSRRGPGPVFTPKPDITHVGGGVHLPWKSGASSIKVVTPDDKLTARFGTSFAAPIASSMAAHAWQAVEGHPHLSADPSMVKALMIHAAQLASPDYDRSERRYLGAGRPDDVIRTLYDSDDSFTLVFQAKVAPSMRWRKSPYPIPKALMHDGKFRGEIIITAAYAPPLDPNWGSEYVRANIELGFGVLNGERISGRVPMEGEAGQSGYETAQVEQGGKWSPIKVHRRSFPEGTAGDIWALQASVFLRAFEPRLEEALPVTVIVTLRSLDGETNVHADGLRALGATNWVHNTLPVRVPVNA
ncbi:S8 family anti-phage peptidase IteS [Pseudomonas aeruginosa]|uniref:S8 family anti-phage peptidase IteS n=2 Tax=Pseudomonas aeruginosa TaxID=287 RepID=UPI0031B6B6D8